MGTAAGCDGGIRYSRSPTLGGGRKPRAQAAPTWTRPGTSDKLRRRTAPGCGAPGEPMAAESFDAIVIGAGQAGPAPMTIASKLSAAMGSPGAPQPGAVLRRSLSLVPGLVHVGAACARGFRPPPNVGDRL